MLRTLVLLSALGFLAPSRGDAQVAWEPAPHPNPLLGSGLFDPSRLDVQHSLSFGVTSGPEGAHSGGLWMSRLGYRLSDPLTVAVDLGASFDPGTGLEGADLFLHRFQLDYRPSRHFQINVSYVNLPPGLRRNAAILPGLGTGLRPVPGNPPR